MDSDLVRAAQANRLVATPVVALAGDVLINDNDEKILAMRFKLLNDTTFGFSWLAARAFQYRDRFQEALDMKQLERWPLSISEAFALSAARLGLACQALEQLETPKELMEPTNLAKLSAAYVLPSNEGIISITTNGNRTMVAVLDNLAVHAFIALVHRAEAKGLFDERNIL